MSQRYSYSEYPKSFKKKLKAHDKEMKNGENSSKKKKVGKVILIILLILLLLFVIAAGITYFLWQNGKKNLPDYNSLNINTDEVGLDDGSAPIIHDAGAVIEYKGEIYDINKNMVSFAMMGIDKEIFGLDDGAVGTGGQADTIAVAAYDSESGKVRIIVIPRDTMADVNVFDVEGHYKSIEKHQICVSYAYGDGKENSSENTLTSINRLLFGIPVKYYLTLDQDGIPALNDLIGGVTVTSLEDFKFASKGQTVTLTGQEADSYVRKRDLAKLESDSLRRARQKQYISAFADKTVKAIKDDFTLVPKFYNKAMDYVITNISLDTATYIASTVVTNNIKFNDFDTVPGEYKMGERNAEYNVDNQKLFELVLDVYYIKRG